MVALAHLLSSLALLASGAAGARNKLTFGAEEVQSAEHTPNAKEAKETISGVPVLNLQAAQQQQKQHGGDASVQAHGEVDWMLVLKQPVSADEVKQCCGEAKHGCKFAGKNVPILEMRGTEADLKAVLESTACQGKVELIEPDQTMYAIPEIIEHGDDALTAQQTLWGLARINAAGRPATGNGVTVFVLDTGVRTTHQDFGGRAIPTLDMSSGSAVECNGATSCAADNGGHGTHCAGTAAGTSYGVAPSATVRGMKVLSDSGSGSFAWGITAIDWIVTSNIRPAVASMSLGAVTVYTPIARAIDTATAAGVTVVVAAGNEDRDACDCSPAHAPSAITIGSTTSRNERSSFSNYGRCTDMWAPGSSIRSAGHQGDTDQATMSGTSMACPHVSGGAALVLEQNPTFKGDQVTSALLANAWADTITDLKVGDTNKELYVGSDAPPPAGGIVPTPAPPTPAPLACPPGGQLTNPDGDGDCQCSLNPPQFCWHKGVFGDCPAVGGMYRHNTWFTHACGADCECKDPEPVCEVLVRKVFPSDVTKKCGKSSGGVCYVHRFCTVHGTCSARSMDEYREHAAYSNNTGGVCDGFAFSHAASVRGSAAMTIGLLLWWMASSS